MNLESCIALVMGRRWLTILLSLLVVLALTAGTLYIVQVDVDYRNHFSEDDPQLIALEQLEDTYAISDTALVAVAPQNGTIFTRETLIAITVFRTTPISLHSICCSTSSLCRSAST